MNHFIDVGANIGQTFDDFLCATTDYDGWTIWCIGPSPRHIVELTAKAAQIRPRFDVRVCAFGFGLGGIEPFFWKDDPRGDSRCHYLSQGRLTINTDQLLIATVPFNAFLRSLPEPERVIVKLDCEGTEYDILQGLVEAPELGMIESILVEWHEIREEGDALERARLTDYFAKAGKELQGWYF